ncbi:hypothetical protein DZA50_02310 [Kangiella sp. HD9-110m-PIT-SAG07]|nr:hypothetical protein DZA50_02310 [Kangiella sp. HD9-110m-PIT-SAG07]
MRYRFILWLLIIASLITIGGLSYLQSGRDIEATVWLRDISPSAYYWLMALANNAPTIYLSGWVDFHLADIMWSASFAMIICGIWVNQIPFFKLLLVGIGCAIFYEVLQLFGVVKGTFDALDLMYSLGAGALGTTLTYYLLKKYKIKEQYNENSGSRLSG